MTRPVTDVPSSAATASPRSTRSGVLYGLGAYAIWGGMPFYFLALAPAGPWEILVNRVLWSAALCLVLLQLTGDLTPTLHYVRRGRQFVGVALAGALIAVNWTIYLVAVTSGRVSEAALGYFLNPLFSVALGLVVLRERLRPLQWLAVGIGAVGAGYLAVEAGHPSWIAVGLALSFGLYGLMKKRVGVQLPPLASLTAETILVAPAALVGLAALAAAGALTVTGHGAAHAGLLASTGVVTAVPLLLFAASARRVSLVTIGLLQFVAPVLQFASALLLGEHLSRQRWVGFAVVWLALVVLMVDLVGIGLRRRAPTYPAPPSR